MTGFCDERDDIRTFRVDRIENRPKLLVGPAVKRPKGYRVERYTQEVTRMFSTNETIEVVLRCDVDLMKAVIDKFGSNVRTKPVGEKQFFATVKVCPSPTFYRWVFGWDGKIKIDGPDSAIAQYKTMLLDEISTY